MESIETKRIDHLKNVISESVKIEEQALPRIRQCLEEIQAFAHNIKPEQVTKIKYFYKSTFCHINF
jgi:hypothetical protein